MTPNTPQPRVSDALLALMPITEAGYQFMKREGPDDMETRGVALVLDLRDARAALAASQARVAALREVLVECEEFFDNRADADAQGDPARYVGNAEMTMLGIVRAALSAPSDTEAR